MNSKIATNINTLGKFCEIRDINELSQEKLLECYGIRQADAIKNNIAKKYIIVGDAGHTTETLRQKIHLETKSTNCGNNYSLYLKRDTGYT